MSAQFQNDTIMSAQHSSKMKWKNGGNQMKIDTLIHITAYFLGLVLVIQ